jgi:tRNA G18 (ribose-2'-O)-methylase SpoU
VSSPLGASVADRGYFGVGIFQPKHWENVGTLWRSAYQLGAAFLVVVGRRPCRQSSDTVRAWRRVPLFQYDGFDDMAQALYDCPAVAVELGGQPLLDFSHPARCLYLLGSEDGGLPESVMARCAGRVTIPAARLGVYNVAMAGTLVMYDRFIKEQIEYEMSPSRLARSW